MLLAVTGVAGRGKAGMLAWSATPVPLQMARASRSTSVDTPKQPQASLWGLQDAKIADMLAGMKAELNNRSGNAGRSLVVLGNTGGDMDSVVDAIAVATFLRAGTFSNFLAHERPAFGNESGCSGAYRGIAKEQIDQMYDAIFPVINFKREHFHLRKDEDFVLLDMLNITEESLIFIDDIRVDDTTRFFLVDHNSIDAAEFQAAGGTRASQVDFVVDHHTKKADAPQEGSIDCYINLVGSCASLVATLINEANSSFLPENPEWATLLLAAMHQDWDPEKTKQHDRDAMTNASQWSLWSQQLRRKKRDVQGFTVKDFFLKDAKGGKSGGVAFTMPELPITSMSAFMSGADSGTRWPLEDFQRQVTSYMEENQYDAVFLLKVADQSPPPGEFAVITKNASLVRYMGATAHLQPKDGTWYANKDPHLRREESKSPFARLRPPLASGYWTFGGGSRKQMLPMVKDMLEKFAELV